MNTFFVGVPGVAFDGLFAKCLSVYAVCMTVFGKRFVPWPSNRKLYLQGNKSSVKTNENNE